MATQRTNTLPELDRDLRFIPLGVDEPRRLSDDQIRRQYDRGHLFPIDVFLQFAKLPSDGKRVSWHQNAFYWPLTPSRVVCPGVEPTGHTGPVTHAPTAN